MVILRLLPDSVILSGAEIEKLTIDSDEMANIELLKIPFAMRSLDITSAVCADVLVLMASFLMTGACFVSQQAISTDAGITIVAYAIVVAVDAPDVPGSATVVWQNANNSRVKREIVVFIIPGFLWLSLCWLVRVSFKPGKCVVYPDSKKLRIVGFLLESYRDRASLFSEFFHFVYAGKLY